MKSANCLLAVAGIAVAQFAPAQTVHVVESFVPDFFNPISLQPTIDGAAPGDTIIARGPGYYEFSVLDKPLHLIAEGGASWSGATPSIRDIDEGVASIQAFRLVAGGLRGLSISNCEATIWLESLPVDSNQAFVSAEVVDCANVCFVDCDFAGTRPLGGDAGDRALCIVDSNVVLQSGTVLGDTLCSLSADCSGSEINAIGATRSTVRTQGSFIRGGISGQFTPDPPNVGVAVDLVDSTFVGAGNTLVTFAPGPGLPAGPLIRLDATSAALEAPAPPLGLQVPTAVREGDSFSFEFSGAAGDAVVLTVTTAPAWSASPFGGGEALLMGANLEAIPVGALSPAGELSLPSGAGALAPGLDAMTFYVQAIAVDLAAGVVKPGEGQVVTILSSSV